MTVVFREVGNSMTVTIPKHIVTKCGLVKGMEADVELDNDVIKFKPKVNKSEITLESLFADYHGKYSDTEVDWGEPRGREVW